MICAMSEPPSSEPTLAQRARTALAQARVGSLISRNSAAAGSLTLVRVSDQPDGEPLVQLEPGSHVVRLLGWCPVVTVAIPGPTPFRALHLTGTASRCAPLDERLSAYRLTLLSTRLVSTTSVTVPVAEFRDAEPDPLWRDAPAALTHLAEAHTAELLACVRAHDFPDAEAVLPRALDRFGLELAVITDQGVRSLRLGFPGAPVRSFDEVNNGLRALLTCRCHGCRHRATDA